MKKKNEIKSWATQNRTSLLWTLLLVLAAGATIYFSLPCWRSMKCSGGDPLGLRFGELAVLAIGFSVAYSLRKNLLHRLLLPLEQWLYAHVVIGALSLFFVVAHSGFQFQNKVAVLALVFLVLTVLSGVVGLFLFYFLPRRQIREAIAVLVPVELCQRLSKLHEEISDLCSEKAGVFLEIYNERVIPLYRAVTEQEPLTSADVSPWANAVSAEDQESFMQLAAKVEEVHDLIVLLRQNLKFQRRLRAWLLFHIPATIGLCVFTTAHLISVFWYGAFR